MDRQECGLPGAEIASAASRNRNKAEDFVFEIQPIAKAE